jgi:hypothetical protein
MFCFETIPSLTSLVSFHVSRSNLTAQLQGDCFSLKKKKKDGMIFTNGLTSPLGLGMEVASHPSF